jgi:hypothetical protein
MKILERLRNRSSQDRAREQKAALVKAGIRSDPPATRTDVDHPPVLKTNTHHSPSTAWTQSATRETSESGYVTKRATVASASSFTGHGSTAGERPARAKLRELQRASDGAAARLRRAEAAAIPTHPPT